MFHRMAPRLLLGVYLAAGLMAGSMPHAEGCATLAHDSHSHDAEHADGWQAQAGPNHDDDCSVCNFLGLRYVATALAAGPPRVEQLDVLSPSAPTLPVAMAVSLHDARGPPQG